MAIQSPFTSPFNADTLQTYAFDAQFLLDGPARAIKIAVLRYADEASFKAGKKPLETLTFNITGADFDAHVAANRQAYGMVKTAIENFLLTQPQFAGGTAVP